MMTSYRAPTLFVVLCFTFVGSFNAQSLGEAGSVVAVESALDPVSSPDANLESKSIVSEKEAVTSSPENSKVSDLEDEHKAKDPMSSSDMESGQISTDVYPDGKKDTTSGEETKIEEPPPPPAQQVKIEQEEPIVEVKKIFYINMDKDIERRHSITEQLRMHASNIQHVRVHGVSVDELGSNPDFQSRSLSGECCAEGKTCSSMFDKVVKNQRSCCCDFSHREAFKQISEQEDGLYLVIEDDVEFDPDWQAKLREVWPSVPNDWSVVRLGFWGDMHPDDRIEGTSWLRARRDRGKWNVFKGYYGAHAILLTPSKAKSLLNSIKHTQLDYADKFTAQTKIGDTILNNYVLENCIVCVVTNEENMPTGSSSRMEASTSFSLLAGNSIVLKDEVTGKVTLEGGEVKGLHVRKASSTVASVVSDATSELRAMEEAAKNGGVAALMPQGV